MDTCVLLPPKKYVVGNIVDVALQQKKFGILLGTKGEVIEKWVSKQAWKIDVAYAYVVG